MNTELVSLQLPASLYEKLQTIAIAFTALIQIAI